MTALDQPCSDGTRRGAFMTFREHGIADHHTVLPWAGIRSLSRESGVTEGAVLQLIAWVREGCPRVVYDYRGPDYHSLVTFLPDGDVEFACLTDQEYRAMASSPRPIGRIRMPSAPAPVIDVVVPEPVAPAVPEPTPVVPPAPTPMRGSRPVGRIRMPTLKAVAIEPAPIATEIVVEAVPAVAPVPAWLRERVLVRPPKPWPRTGRPLMHIEACGPPSPPMPPLTDAESAEVLRALGGRP